MGPTHPAQKKYPAGRADGVRGAYGAAKLAPYLLAQLGHEAFPHFLLLGRVVRRRIIHHPQVNLIGHLRRIERKFQVVGIGQRMALLIEKYEAHGTVQALTRNFGVMILVVPDKIEPLTLYIAHIVAKPLRKARGRSQVGKKNFG